MSSAAPTSRDPFHDIRLRVKSNEPHIRSANIVLAALTDVIQSSSGLSIQTSSLTDLQVAYFGALITSLSQHDKHNTDTLAGVTYLVSFIVRRLPPQLIRHHLSAVIPLLNKVLSAHHDNAVVVRCTSTTAAAMLSTLTSLSEWQHGQSLALFASLLTFSADARPKVRRDAQSALHDVIAALTQNAKPLAKPLCQVIVTYVKQAAAAYHTKTINDTLYVCGLLQSIIIYLPAATAANVLEQMLSLPILTQSILFVQTMRIVTALCSAGDTATTTSDQSQSLPASPKLLALYERLTSSLVSLRPHIADIDANIEYLHSIIRLYHKITYNNAIDSLHQYLVSLSQTLLSPKPSVVSECAVAMIALIRKSINENTITHSQTQVQEAIEDVQVCHYAYNTVIHAYTRVSSLSF